VALAIGVELLDIVLPGSGRIVCLGISRAYSITGPVPAASYEQSIAQDTRPSPLSFGSKNNKTIGAPCNDASVSPITIAISADVAVRADMNHNRQYKTALNQSHNSTRAP